jgi:hypothetical protein
MRTISVVSVFVFAFAFAALAASACDSMPGMGGQQQPIVQPVQIPAIPGQIPAVPGQIPVPTVPGQIPAVPGQVPVPAVPGQIAVPPTPVGAAPVVPGQPVAAVPGQPAAVAPVAPPTPPVPTGDLLTDRMNEVKLAQAADRTATSALVKVTLAAGKAQSYQVQLPGPPYCHTFVAVGDDNVKNVDLVIESPMAVPEALDSTTDNRAFIANHCPTTPGAYKLTAKMVDGTGEVAVQVFSK